MRAARAADEDEAAQIAAALVGLECDRSIELELAYPDLVQLEPLGRQMLTGMTSILYFSGATVAETDAVPIFIL